MKEESKLKKLKEDYAKIQSKYKLPSFEKMNEDFGIEKISENETELLTRELKKFIWEKLSNYMRLIEAIINPTNASLFVFSIVKNLREEDKKKLSEFYKELAEIELQIIAMDLNFSEEADVAFVKEKYKWWQEVKVELSEIVKNIKKNWDGQSKINEKGYFG